MRKKKRAGEKLSLAPLSPKHYWPIVAKSGCKCQFWNNTEMAILSPFLSPIRKVWRRGFKLLESES